MTLGEPTTRPPELGSDVDQIVTIARAAGEILLSYFRSGLAVDRKGPRDLITRADLESEELVCSALREAFPGDGVLAEEGGGVDVAGERPLWIVDPLDGTTNFAHGHPFFAVSIARYVNSESDLGVVHAPYLGETFFTKKEHGAFLNGHRLRVSSVDLLSDALIATGFSYRRREVEAGSLGIFGDLLGRARDLRRGGSAALDLCYTAMGVFAGYYEYYLAPHDVAAGGLMVEEAGGRVSDVSGGRDFVFGHSIAAGTPVVHQALLEQLQDAPAHPGV